MLILSVVPDVRLLSAIFVNFRCACNDDVNDVARVQGGAVLVGDALCYYDACGSPQIVGWTVRNYATHHMSVRTNGALLDEVMDTAAGRDSVEC